MKTRFIEEPVPYTGRELRAGWIRERTGLGGGAIVAFMGSCSVRGGDLVDLEDRAAGLTVEGERMLHFIAEIPGVGLPEIVFVQRLLCIAAKDAIEATGKASLRRVGDDLYFGDGKLSVSIASATSAPDPSGLVHLGINITTDGVPVKAECLEDLGVDYRELAPRILSEFAEEMESSFKASRKVRPVE